MWAQRKHTQVVCKKIKIEVWWMFLSCSQGLTEMSPQLWQCGNGVQPCADRHKEQARAWGPLRQAEPRRPQARLLLPSAAPGAHFRAILGLLGGTDGCAINQATWTLWLACSASEFHKKISQRVCLCDQAGTWGVQPAPVSGWLRTWVQQGHIPQRCPD